MILDRTQAPVSFPIQSFSIPPIQTQYLSNGLPLYQLPMGKQPLVRLELVFRAGTKQEQSHGASYFAVKMLSEGTKKYSSSEISKLFDSHGAFLELNHHADSSSLVVQCLSKHLENLLPVITSMLQEAIFPDEELANTKNIISQNLQVNLQKTSFVAGQTLKEKIFGETHAYGKSLDLETIEIIAKPSVQEHYEQCIKNSRCQIFIAGDIPKNLVEAIENILGSLDIHENVPIANSYTEKSQIAEKTIIDKTGSVQSSIRIGRQMMTRKNSDFVPFLVANEVFGGYFGSRLMKNIREDKGFTYGISSNLVPFVDAGYWVIGTDVNRENTQETLDEIEKEINLMKTRLVPEDELEKAKSYMMGQFIGSLNTPFELIERHKVMISNELPSNFYDNHIDRIKAVSAQQVQAMANKYFNDLHTVVVGGVN